MKIKRVGDKELAGCKPCMGMKEGVNFPLTSREKCVSLIYASTLFFTLSSSNSLSIYLSMSLNSLILYMNFLLMSLGIAFWATKHLF